MFNVKLPSKISASDAPRIHSPEPVASNVASVANVLPPSLTEDILPVLVMVAVALNVAPFKITPGALHVNAPLKVVPVSS